jgi:hypothetical protein
MTGSIGGHALIALSSALMTCQFFTATQGRVWVVRLMDREPIVFFSCLLGGVGCARAAGVVFYMLRRALVRGARAGAGVSRGARARGPPGGGRRANRGRGDRTEPPRHRRFPRRMPIVIPPVRKALGLSTSQLDGDTPE